MLQQFRLSGFIGCIKGFDDWCFTDCEEGDDDERDYD